MALINCPECGARISDKATSCPHCGCPMEDLRIQWQDAFHDQEDENPENPYAGVFTQNENKPTFWDRVKAQAAKKVIAGVTIDPGKRTISYGIFKIIPFEDIINVEIYENGSSMSKTSTASVVGRSAIGALFNPAGAIIGGVTAKKKHVDVVNKMEVIITTRNTSKSNITVNIPIPKKTKKDSKDYDKAIKKAQELKSAILAAMSS